MSDLRRVVSWPVPAVAGDNKMASLRCASLNLLAITFHACEAVSTGTFTSSGWLMTRCEMLALSKTSSLDISRSEESLSFRLLLLKGERASQSDEIFAPDVVLISRLNGEELLLRSFVDNICIKLRIGETGFECASSDVVTPRSSRVASRLLEAFDAPRLKTSLP